MLLQVWYPMTVATQTREFRKTFQAYSFLSERVSQGEMNTIHYFTIH
jgi:hypothetical protein